MATIQLTASEWEWYKKGKSGYSVVVGYEDKSRRVGRYKFTAPSTGATSVSFAFYSSGRGAGNHIPIKFYIGTDPDSHANAGPDSTATGTLTLGDDWLTFTGSADILLIPNQIYYLWIFPGADTFGWYWASRANYTSTLTTHGAAMSDISAEDGTLGQAHTIKLTRYSDALTNTITAVCGSETMVVATDITYESVEWTPPVSWAAQNTEDITVPVTLTCITYEDKKEIGRTTQSLLFSIPEFVAPTATVSLLDTKGHAGKYGAFVQGRSVISVQVAAMGAYGSEIKECKIKVGDEESHDTVVSFTPSNAGNIPVVVTVTDSRGRIGKATTAAYVIAYAAPTVTILDRYRSDADGNQDDDGTYATISFKANITTLNEKNSANYTAKYRVKGETEWNEVEIANHSGEFAPDGATHIVPIEIDFAYELCIVATDDFSSVESIYRTVQVAFFLISTHKATKAVGIGQKATEEGLCAFGIPAKFNAGICSDDKILILSYNENVGGYVLVEEVNK